MQMIKPEQANNWQGRRIDVRDYDEYLAERLEGCECVPVKDILAQAGQWDRQQAILLMCKTGMRASQAAKQLEQIGFRNVFVMEGGLQAGKASGLQIIRDRKRLPIIRQVMLGAGSLLLAGLVLAHVVHPWFIVMSWMVGAGLVLAGITGFCPMAVILAKLPWNRDPACPTT